MTFLNPILLFGLAAALVPLVLHLLTLRRLRTIDFSSLRFLKELQKSSIRRIRFQQILLLILRTLLMVFLVLAFARPALRGSFAAIGGGEAASTTVILLDDSPSMEVRDERGTSFSRALQSAQRIVDLARDNDHLSLVPLSTTAGSAALPGRTTRTSAHAFLADAHPSSVSVPFRHALMRVNELLAASTDANHEVVIITDGQATQFGGTVAGEHLDTRRPLPGEPATQQGGTLRNDTTGRFDPLARLFVLMSPPSHHGNAGILDAEILTRIVAGNRPVRLSAQVGNFDQGALHGAVTSVYLGSDRVAQRSVDLPPEGVTAQEYEFSPRRRGIVGGYVEIQEDLFEPDNRRYFTLDIPRTISVLLAGPVQASTTLPHLALSLAGDSILAGYLATQQMTTAEIPSVDLGTFDVLILCGVKSLSRAAVQNISAFVRGGGGLILFPGPDDPPDAYNNELLPALGLPPVAGSPTIQSGESFLSISTIDYAHPLLEGMFGERPGIRKRAPAIESPRIRTSLPLTTGSSGSAIITLSNGRPFLSETPVRSGRVLFFAVEAGLGWSDFPVKGLFAPLLHRAVLYLSMRSTAGQPLLTGEQLRIASRLREFTERDVFFLVRPDGSRRRVVPAVTAGTGMAIFDGGIADEPGVYAVLQDSSGQKGAVERILAAAAVNIPREESDLRPAADSDSIPLWKSVGIDPSSVRFVATGEAAAESIRLSRYGVELWQWCLILALLCALAEMVVGRVAGKNVRRALQSSGFRGETEGSAS